MVKIIIQNKPFEVSDKVILYNQYVKYLHKTNSDMIEINIFDNFNMTTEQLSQLVFFLENHDYDKLDIDIILQLYYLPDKYICDRDDIINYLSSIQTNDIHILEQVYEFSNKNHIKKILDKLLKSNASLQYIQLLKQLNDIDFEEKFRLYYNDNKNQYHDLYSFYTFLSYTPLKHSKYIGIIENKNINPIFGTLNQFITNMYIFSCKTISNDFPWKNVIMAGGSCFTPLKI